MVDKVRRMTIKGAVPPTEKTKKISEDASKRLKTKREKEKIDKEEIDKKRDTGKIKDKKVDIEKKKMRQEDCYWSKVSKPLAELSWEDLQNEVAKEI